MSLKVFAKPGMAPCLPVLIRLTMNSSLRFVPASLGPLPATWPPCEWHHPQDVANSLPPSGAGSAAARVAGMSGTAPTNKAAAKPREIAPRRIVTRWLFQRIHDQRAGILRHTLERLAEDAGIIVAHQTAPAGRHRDVLLAAGGVADDAADMAKTVIVRPQLLAGRRVIGVQDAGRVRHEDEVAGGREHAGERRLRIAHL